MKRRTIVTLSILAGAALFSAGAAYAQFWSETPEVVYLSKANMDALYNSIPDQSRNQDQSAFIIDIGPYNLGVNTQHRTVAEAPKPGEGVLFHSNLTEIYYIQEGRASFVTQSGAISRLVATRKWSKEDTYQRLTDNQLNINAPSGFAEFSGKPVTREIGPGDILVIPPFTGHYLSQLHDKYIRYLVYRVDPFHSIPAGYVNPVFRKMGKTKPSEY